MKMNRNKSSKVLFDLLFKNIKDLKIELDFISKEFISYKIIFSDYILRFEINKDVDFVFRKISNYNVVLNYNFIDMQLLKDISTNILEYKQQITEIVKFLLK